MRKFLLVFTLAILAVLPVFSTEYSVFMKNNLKGLADENGNEIIPAQYDEIGWSRGTTSLVGKVIGYKENNRWGLINTKNEKVTRAIYSYLLPYKKDLVIAGLRKDGTNRSAYGLIDTDGDIVIEPAYKVLTPAGEALIAAKDGLSDLKFGLINDKNEAILPLKYKHITYLEGNRIAVKDDNTALYAVDGRQLSPFIYSHIEAFQDGTAIAVKGGKSGVLALDGSVIQPMVYRTIVHRNEGKKGKPFTTWKILTGSNELLAEVNYDSLVPAGKDLYRALSVDGERILNGKGKELTGYCNCEIIKVYPDYALIKEEDKYGLLDREGEWVLPAKYDSLIVDSSFYLVAATTSTKIKEWVMLDHEKKKVSEYTYQNLKYTDNGLLPVQRRGLWGYMDRKGKEVIPAIYQAVYPYWYDMAVVDYMGAQGVVDRKGDWVISPKDGEVSILSQNRFLVKSREGYGVVDQFRRSVYTSPYPIEVFDKNYLLQTTSSEKLGLLDFSGNMVLSSMYDAVSPLMEDTVYMFDKGNKRGLLSKHGRVMVPVENEFEEFHDMNEDFFGVRIGGKYGFVDVNGDLRIANRYDSIGFFQEGYAPIMLRGHWGFVDKIERLMVQPLYDKVYPFENGTAIVRLRGKYGVINKNGDLVIEPKYNKITRGPSGRIVVREGEKYGLFSATGKSLIIPKYEMINDLPGKYVIILRNGKYGVTTERGMSTVPAIYDNIIYDDINRRFMAASVPAWKDL